eukprot:scaffold1509_cov240-Pinguiococcus_pyrenoidosus.AAC.2
MPPMPNSDSGLRTPNPGPPDSKPRTSGLQTSDLRTTDSKPRTQKEPSSFLRAPVWQVQALRVWSGTPTTGQEARGLWHRALWPFSRFGTLPLQSLVRPFLRSSQLHTASRGSQLNCSTPPQEQQGKW